jgi:hypothetical protein
LNGKFAGLRFDPRDSLWQDRREMRGELLVSYALSGEPEMFTDGLTEVAESSPALQAPASNEP